ncbi:ferritin-like domain-containing protein [Danxiaibacter flavus]|uniref:Ferritin-like domain-containing protein n=1 Tax=Danxiaibacter flavus TaxID=3049108 RepID=A0ABV3ZGK9_9BACT|nr:ferritin-like domain-containing protein [Chitinophagaceae bacterium DXS]
MKNAASGNGDNMSESMKNSEFHKLFVDEVKDIYWAEKALVKALTKMQKAATSEELASAFAEHQSQTEGHVQRLEQVFELLEMKPVAKKCPAMEGLIQEAEELKEETEDGSSVRDAALISAAQKVEHYEIASYGTLATFAKTMGHSDIAKLLEQTLNEEKETDSNLTRIAESMVNEEALHE